MMRLWRPFVVLAGLVLLWQLIVWVTDAPRYILPGPPAVLKALAVHAAALAGHAGVTLAEILLGWR